MEWSYSSYRGFLKCQLQWFYKHKLASSTSKELFRNEVFHLSNLSSISGWRGSIVDYTIESYLIPLIKKKQNISLSNVIKYAKDLSRTRYDFAKDKKYRENDIVKTKLKYQYSAIYDFEYGINETDIKQKIKEAWDDIELSLTNFVNNKEFIDYLKESNYMITQRNLQFNLNGFNVKGVPDLIVFFKDKPPHIFDWKVHTFAQKNYFEQLITYAIALKSCTPHIDFPSYLAEIPITSIKISEYQLIHNRIRNYEIISDAINNALTHIEENSYAMSLANCGKKYTELNIEDFEPAWNSSTCHFCSFKKICKEVEL